MVLAVSLVGLGEACSGAVGFIVAMLSRLLRVIFRPVRPDVGASAKKFALLAFISARARKSSPSGGKTPQIRCFMACWANFVAEMPLEAPWWASFFAPTDAPRFCRRRVPSTPAAVGVWQHEEVAVGVS